MKKFVSFFLLFTIIISLLNTSGCLTKKSFTPFPTTDQKLLGPQKPIEKWTFTWETDKTDSNPQFDQSYNPAGLWKDPCVDSLGNVYFSDFQEYIKLRGNIFALSEAGKLLWKRSKTLTIKMDELKDGFINQETKTTSMFTKNNSSNKTYQLSDSFLGQDKMLYGIQNKKNWLLSIKNFFNRYWYFWFFGVGHVFDTNIVSMDYQGKIKWTYKIPQIDKEKRRFVKDFCDTKGNDYFVFDQAKEDDATFNNRVPVYEMYSLTSTGKLRWKKEYPTKHFAGEDYGKKFDLLSNKLVVGNSFLVSETKIPPYGNVEYYLQCLTTDGNLLWETKMQEDCELKVPYTMLDEKTFLVPIQDTKVDSTFLQAISSENGKVLWEKEIDSKHSTSPVVDVDGNIYIGAGGTEQKPRTIYSFTNKGTLRWSMVQTNPDQAFGTNLALGVNHTLYYGLQGTNLLYCIGEK
jgi:outer membrane protein assembly factor BamB